MNVILGSLLIPSAFLLVDVVIGKTPNLSILGVSWIIGLGLIYYCEAMDGLRYD